MPLGLVPTTDPVLRQPCREVSDIGSQRLADRISEMEDVRLAAHGIGIAAPQVGISERIIIVEVPEGEMVGVSNNVGHPPTVLINPVIVAESDEWIKLPEGCLSLPGLMGNVSRPEAITIEAYDPSGERIIIMAEKWLARVLQHEIDHLEGILFIDRVEDPSELWRVERVDIDDPLFDHNPSIDELRASASEASVRD